MTLASVFTQLQIPPLPCQGGPLVQLCQWDAPPHTLPRREGKLWMILSSSNLCLPLPSKGENQRSKQKIQDLS